MQMKDYKVKHSCELNPYKPNDKAESGFADGGLIPFLNHCEKECKWRTHCKHCSLNFDSEEKLKQHFKLDCQEAKVKYRGVIQSRRDHKTEDFDEKEAEAAEFC